MGTWVGIDLGTSSVKCIALRDDGTVLGTTQASYPVLRPHPGWAEQIPGTWWAAVCSALRELTDTVDRSSIAGIGLSGQMHGAVPLAGDLSPVRPAIIWPDRRSAEQVRAFRDSLPEATLEERTGFRAASGMAAVSSLWMSEYEQENWERTRYIVQPKDYIRLRLTGRTGLDHTDAGATLFFNISTGELNEDVLAVARADDKIFPKPVDSICLAGSVTTAAAEETGLLADTPVAAGGSDQATAALGLQLTTRSGVAAIALGSGGTCLLPMSSFGDIPAGYHRLKGALPSDCYAMGVILAGGLATDWLATRTGIDTTRLLDEAASAEPDERLVALSDFGGVRTPVPSSVAQGAFIGLGFDHTPAQLARALVEASAASLSDSLRALAAASGSPLRQIALTGGGARHQVWRQAVADTCRLPVLVHEDLEYSAIGAALCGALACGADVDIEPIIRVRETVEPDPASLPRLDRQRAARAAVRAAIFDHDEAVQGGRHA